MAKTSYFHCLIQVCIAIISFNHVSCSNGSYRRATCKISYGQPPRTRGVGSQDYPDVSCFQYIDQELMYSFTDYDCNDEEYPNLNCCDGVCKCCDSPNCSDDETICRDLAMTGSSSTGSCERPVAPRGPCTEYFGNEVVKAYPEEYCIDEYPYMNCCHGKCICCDTKNACSYDGGGSKASCMFPAKFSGANGSTRYNKSISS